jgi:hypothetical protein
MRNREGKNKTAPVLTQGQYNEILKQWVDAYNPFEEGPKPSSLQKECAWLVLQAFMQEADITPESIFKDYKLLFSLFSTNTPLTEEQRFGIARIANTMEQAHSLACVMQRARLSHEFF